jgi:hypothetical protein
MVNVYIADCADINKLMEEDGTSGLEYNPTSENFNAEKFKTIAVLHFDDIRKFVIAFNQNILHIDDSKYYIYLEI